AQAQREQQRADDEANRARRNLYGAQMNLAQVAWDDARLGRLEQLLDLQTPQHTAGLDLRGWEWHYWQRRCHASQLTWSTGKHGGLSGVAVSPDGKHIAAATSDGAVVIDSQSGATVRTIPAPRAPNTMYNNLLAISGVLYSPDGKWFAARCFGGNFL